MRLLGIYLFKRNWFDFKKNIDEDFGSNDVVLMINKGHHEPVGF
jgi:hypothetical protein